MALSKTLINRKWGNEVLAELTPEIEHLRFDLGHKRELEISGAKKGLHFTVSDHEYTLMKGWVKYGTPEAIKRTVEHFVSSLEAMEELETISLT